MDLVSISKLIEEAYIHIDGYKVSNDNQRKLGYFYLGYEYGESLIDSFYSMLFKSKPRQGEVFYDLGSGLGKKVIAAALGFPFKKAIGIEVVPGLHTIATNILNSKFSSYKNIIQLFNADYLQKNIYDGDIYYVSIHPDILRLELSGPLLKKFELTKKGTRIITSNIVIPSQDFIVEEEQDSKYTSGTGKMYLHRKIN